VKNVLFVDDEPRVLSGLQRMLRPMRHEWNMTFVNSGREALDKLAAAPFDVIVTDMRMPEMDGAELLHHVSERHPDTIRIVLSGQTDDETAMRVVDLAHQCLAKPCDPERLKHTLQRASALRGVLSDPGLEKLVSKMDHLPSLPSLYGELLKELKSPQSTSQRVAKIVAKDVGMTTKTLHLVNSAFFGLRYNVTSLDQAIALLGMKTVRSLAMTVQVFSQFESIKVADFSVQGIMDHSVATGTYAKQIAAIEGRKEYADEAFMAGLLHDTGRLVLLDRMPEKYAETLTLSKESKIPLVQAEKDVFGATHAEVGSYLLGLWGLPDPTLEALAYHHNPDECLHRQFSPLTAVHAANSLGQSEAETLPEWKKLPLCMSYLESMDLADHVTDWRNVCIAKTDNDSN